jgi:hypothetical protein
LLLQILAASGFGGTSRSDDRLHRFVVTAPAQTIRFGRDGLAGFTEVALMRAIGASADGHQIIVSTHRPLHCALMDILAMAPGPHPRREPALTPRLGFTRPRLSVAAGAFLLALRLNSDAD